MVRMLPITDRHACRMCAIWVCDECGWRRMNAAKTRPEKQFCAHCQSRDGFFVDVRHMHPRIQREHDEDAREFIDKLPRIEPT
jgi:hypothetical protein